MDAAPRHRLFVALTVPSGVAAHIERAVAHLPSGLVSDNDLRWVAPERWHITLAFLGSTPAGNLPRLAATLPAAAQLPGGAPEISLRGAGQFGHRAVWLGVQQPASRHDPLRYLARAVRRACRAARCPTDDHQWRPHLTLARLRRGGEPAVIDDVRRCLADYRGPSWSADSITLFESLLGPNPRHVALGSWPVVSAHPH